MSKSSNEPVLNSRRNFLGKMGLVGTGALLGACSPMVTAQTPPPKQNLDVAILNFALNLEYLEAAFYLAAVGRLGELTPAGGDASKVTLPSGFNGSSAIPGLSQATLAYAQEIATDELNHVKALRATILALKGVPVVQPQLDLGPAFAAAGAAAGLPAGVTFNPFANEVFFLHGAFVFEDVGVTAYKGAARLITDDSAGGVLEAAAGILAVEAYHAGAIRTLLYQIKDSTPIPGNSLTVAQIVQAISNLRDGADGPDDLDQGIVGGAGNPNYVTGANLVPTDANSIAFSRTTDQVLSIVYLGGAKGTGGGFFPNGLNGTLR